MAMSVASRCRFFPQFYGVVRSRRNLYTSNVVRSNENKLGLIAAKEPFEVTLVANKTYFWCRCGRSKKQPYCDGSHKGTQFSPIKIKVTEDQPHTFLCGCKQTGTPPYCDATHATPDVQES